jgi:hypothetical protein
MRARRVCNPSILRRTRSDFWTKNYSQMSREV